MRIALYDSEKDNAPEVKDLDWHALSELLTKHTRTPCAPCPGKECREKYGPAWSPVELSPCPEQCHNHGLKSARDCGGGQFHRLNANVEAIHAAVFDVDKADMAILRAIAGKLDAAGLGAIVHTSHSHTPAACKFRLVIKLSRPARREEWAKLRKAIESRFEIPADKSTKDLARLYFLPSAPEGAEALAFATDGGALDVDAALASAEANAPAAPRPVNLAPLPEASGEIDFKELRRRLVGLRARYDGSDRDGEHERAILIDRILKSEPLSLEGGKDPVFDGRDDALNRACSLLVAAFPPDTPPAAILELIRPSVRSMPGDPPECGDWLLEAEDMIERARERRAQNDDKRRAWDAEVRQRLMADSRGTDDDAPAVVAPATPRESSSKEQDNEEGESDEPAPAPQFEYTDEQLEQWATEQGTTPEGFERRWIIQRGRAFYVFVGGKYRAPITKDDLPVSLPRDLARAPVALTAEDKDGNSRPLTPATILDRNATVARNVQASLALQRSFYDPKTESFYEAICPLRRVAAKEHYEIGKWLELLGGDQADRLLDWVATVSRLDRQACAIYFDGVKDAGKGLLASGLARLWTAGGPAELARVLEGFNDVLTQCPLIFADEQLPQRKGITAELRRLIGSTARNLNRKFLPTCNLDGAVRLIIAGNNDRLLDTGEDLSSNDLDAVAGRFLYIQPNPKAAQYLKMLGGPPEIGKWITQDLIAEHSLWLRETRKVNESSRFLVEGVVQEFHDHLATGSGLAGLVCEWLVRYLVDPQTQTAQGERGNLVLAGHGEVWVNADAMVRANDWEKRVPSAKVPSAARIGRALRNLSVGSERIKFGDKQHKYHKIKSRLLIGWAEHSTVVDADALRLRINGSCEALARAISLRRPEESTA